MSKKLSRSNRDLFHRTVAKALFLCKRARPDVHAMVAVLCSRECAPGRKGLKMLARMMKYLHMTKNDDFGIKCEERATSN